MLKHIVELTDRAIPDMLAGQVVDKNSPHYGGLIVQGKGFAEPINAFGVVDTYLAAYYCPDSAYYKSPQVLDAAILTMEHVLRQMHDDGTFDLIETNFHDSGGGAYALTMLGYTHRLIKDQASTPKEKEVLALIETLAKESVKPVYEGGFHTPNHRWIQASGMALCYKITEDSRCLEVVETLLGEGVDCNEEGDYTERSIGMYDAWCNNALIIMAIELNKPELLEHVRRNLNRIWYYVESDWQAQTLASRRQDYGKDASMAMHLWAYSFMAKHDQNPKFAWMAQNIKQVNQSHQCLLTKLLLMPEVSEDMPQEPMPVTYKKLYPKAGVARYRNNDLTLTLLNENSLCLKIQYKSFRVYCKLACTFFQFGRLIGQTLEETKTGFVLKSHAEWGYRRPLKGVCNPDWFALPHADREKANWQHHDWALNVDFTEDEVSLHIQTDGTKGIPWKLEMIMDSGGTLYSQGTTMPGTPGGWAILGGDGLYVSNNNWMSIKGGTNQHEYAPFMRNSDPKSPEGFTLYHTGFTPADHKIALQFGRGYKMN